MIKNFEIINGLTDCMSACNLDENKLIDCINCVGCMCIDKPATVLEAMISAQLIPSKSHFRKNPTSLWVNSKEVKATDIWNFGPLAVLVAGKTRTNAVVVFWDQVIQIKKEEWL